MRILAPDLPLLETAIAWHHLRSSRCEHTALPLAARRVDIKIVVKLHIVVLSRLPVAGPASPRLGKQWAVDARREKDHVAKDVHHARGVLTCQQKKEMNKLVPNVRVSVNSAVFIDTRKFEIQMRLPG